MVRGHLTAAWARVMLVVMAALIIVPLALGQLPTATVLGEVKDASGAVMADVTVTATNHAWGLGNRRITAESSIR